MLHGVKKIFWLCDLTSQACGRSSPGIACSNSAEDMDVGLLCFFVCYVGSGLCDELIAYLEESERLYV